MKFLDRILRKTSSKERVDHVLKRAAEARENTDNVLRDLEEKQKELKNAIALERYLQQTGRDLMHRDSPNEAPK